MKKLFTALLSLLLIFVSISNEIVAEVSTTQNLQNTINDAATYVSDANFDVENFGVCTIIKIKNDITIDSQIIIPNNDVQIRIYLQGNTISRELESSTDDGNVFVVLAGAELLMDGGHGKITGGDNNGNGGAFKVEKDGLLYVINTNINENKAKNGGAVYNEGIASFGNCDINNNSATSENGGAIYNAGELSISGESVNDNVSEKDGGAIYNCGSAILNGTYNNNIATTGDGGVVYNKGYLEYKNATTNENSARNGGAIYNCTNSRAEIIGGSITNCKASINGGAIYNEKHSGNELQTVTIGKDTVSSSGTLITGCHATTNGGAIYNKGTIGLGTSTITNNYVESVDGLGGGVYMGDGNIFLGASSVISNNTINGNAKNNLYLCDGIKVSLGTGSDVPSPTTGMNIGIAMKTPGVFTTVDSSYDLGYFTSDDNSKIVSHHDNQELKLGTTYSISFFMNGHGEQIITKAVNPGEKSTKPSDPTDANFNFVGWYSDKEFNNAFDFNNTINNNVYVYAKWRDKNAIPYTITFDMNGHGTQIEAQNIYEDEKVVKPSNPSAEGWDFAGWYTDSYCSIGAEFDFTSTITKNTIIYAKWIQKVKPASESKYVAPKTCVD